MASFNNISNLRLVGRPLGSRLPLVVTTITKLSLSAGAVGRLLPKLVKILLCLLFLVNIRSWPLVWHFRIFRPVFALRLRYRWSSICSMFKTPSMKLKIEDDWWDSISPIGEYPFTKVVRFKSWASLDDSDFNGHLSNSSYAKGLDYGRFRAALEMFPILFRAGGWIALAATNYHFIREIPMLASYEVRTSIAAWDHKWLYVTSKYVRKSSGKKNHTTTTKSTATSFSTTGEEGSTAPTMAIRTPGAEAICTPLQTNTPGDSGSFPQDTENKLMKAVNDELDDNTTLHAVVVSQLCFKIGRITVPPGLVLAVNGFTGFVGHSIENPHPGWSDVKRTMSKPFGGSPKKLKELMAGGWRDVPENERWWDNKCLGERVEMQRVKNISRIDGLRKGLEDARVL